MKCWQTDPVERAVEAEELGYDELGLSAECGTAEDLPMDERILQPLVR